MIIKELSREELNSFNFWEDFSEYLQLTIKNSEEGEEPFPDKLNFVYEGETIPLISFEEKEGVNFKVGDLVQVVWFTPPPTGTIVYIRDEEIYPAPYLVEYTNSFGVTLHQFFSSENLELIF